MKCEKCGVELSPRIYAIHIGLCKAEPNKPELTKDQIIAALKEKEIEFSTRDSKADLKALLEASEESEATDPEDGKDEE